MPRAESRTTPRTGTRLRLRPMYTSVTACPLDDPDRTRHGHAYEVSPTGLRFELDDPFPVGGRIVLRFTLPAAGGEPEADRTFFVQATVRRVVEEDAPGPVRMTAVFDRFFRPADLARLRAFIKPAPAAAPRLAA